MYCIVFTVFENPAKMSHFEFSRLLVGFFRHKNSVGFENSLARKVWKVRLSSLVFQTLWLYFHKLELTNAFSFTFSPGMLGLKEWRWSNFAILSNLRIDVNSIYVVFTSTYLCLGSKVRGGSFFSMHKLKAMKEWMNKWTIWTLEETSLFIRL